MSVARISLLALVAATQVLAGPVPEFELVKRYDPGHCNNQSCIVANIAGNSGVPVSTNPADYPVGDTYSGDCCVITLNPAVKDLAYMFNPKLKNCSPTYDKRSVDAERPLTPGHELMKRHMEERRAAISDRDFEEMQHSQFDKRACTPNILVYAKGTFEPGALGVTIGPELQSDLKSYKGWSVHGINYDPSINDDYCLGLAGGIVGKRTLENVAASCPNSKIVMAGYSQGALIVRNALGNSTLGSRVSGVVTYGDPFEGSPIKNFKGPIQVFCNPGDGVCMGQFDITTAHLSYTSAQAAQGAMYINQMATT